MSTYLKNMGRHKYNQLKSKSYDEIQKLFDNEMKRDELESNKSKKAESSEKKAEGGRKKSISKKRAGKEHKQHMVIVKDDDIEIDAIPLATKPPVIVEYKLIREGIMGHYQLIRADGSFKRYSSMIRMLQGIDREDLETLWKLVKTKHGDTRPEDEHERVLWGDLKVMFEPDIKSDVWRNLQGYKVTVWKLFDSCGVHFVRFGNVHIFMLVEKRYPLTPITITNMLNKKLQADYWNEMCYQLLKLMFRGGLLGLKDFKMILRVTTAQYCWYKSLCCWITTARRITTVRRIKTSKEIRIVWRTRILTKITKESIKDCKEVNANCILMANLYQASTSGTQTNKALFYDLDGLAEPYPVQQNTINVIFNEPSMEHNGGTVKQHPTTIEETHAYTDLLEPIIDLGSLRSDLGFTILVMASVLVVIIGSNAGLKCKRSSHPIALSSYLVATRRKSLDEYLKILDAYMDIILQYKMDEYLSSVLHEIFERVCNQMVTEAELASLQ
ncbi:hypothetical protein Tco_0462252 [Tanacetum coccineum]